MSNEVYGSSVNQQASINGHNFFCNALYSKTCVGMICSTFGDTTPTGKLLYKGDPDVNDGASTSRAKIWDYYYDSRHCCDDLNKDVLSGDAPAIWQVWQTQSWWIRQFTFFLSLSEANARHASNKILQRAYLSKRQFRREFAMELCHTQSYT